MNPGYLSGIRIRQASRLGAGILLLCGAAVLSLQAAQDAAPEVPATATPQILQITPSEASPGAHLAVAIQGNNFSEGATVTSGSTSIQVDSFKRSSATEIDAHISVSESAPAGQVSLLVSNPKSGSAASTFSIVPAQPEPTPNAAPQNPEPANPSAPAPATEPAQPATPQTPEAPPSAPPTAEDNPPAPAPPAAAPEAPAAPPVTPASLPEPVILKVSPRRVCQGFDIDMKVAGKNFVQGTRVSFASEAIRVVGISSYSASEITLHIKVAGDAVPGKTSLFVVNPDDNEAEAAIDIELKGTFPPPATTVSLKIPAKTDPSYTQRFDAFHLGNPTEIFHVHGKVKGVLVIDSETVKYEEDGKTLVDVSLSQIQALKTAMMGQFEIKLESGKTIHFAASSLKGSDATAIVNAIRKAMPNPPPAEDEHPN